MVLCERLSMDGLMVSDAITQLMEAGKPIMEWPSAWLTRKTVVQTPSPQSQLVMSGY